MKPLFPFLSTALLLASCTGTTDQARETTAATDSTAAPTTMTWVGSYADTLPCADCPGTFTRLVLRDDSTYVLYSQYLDRDSIPFGEIGGWTASGDMLTLNNGETPGRYRMANDVLERLDADRKPVDSPLNYSLRRVPRVGAVNMHLSGGYVYYADSHNFTPAGSRFPLPVMGDSAALELERMYTKQVKNPPAPMPVRIIARLQDGPAREGNGTEEYIRVERVEHLEATPVP